MQKASETWVETSGHLASWATEANYHGALPADTNMHATLQIGYPRPHEVEDLAQAISDPESKLYCHFLTVEEFTARHAPTEEYVDFVVAWFKGHGFHIGYIPKNRKFVKLEGSAAKFSASLHTSFAMYYVSGKLLRAPMKEPSLPAMLYQGHELQFEGLDHGWMLQYKKDIRKVPANLGKSFQLGGPHEDEPLVQSDAAAVLAPRGCVWIDSITFKGDPKLG